MSIKRKFVKYWSRLTADNYSLYGMKHRINDPEEKIHKALMVKVGGKHPIVMSGNNYYFTDTEQTFKTLIPFKKYRSKK